MVHTEVLLFNLTSPATIEFEISEGLKNKEEYQGLQKTE
jgi:hypothetical protein